MIKVKIPIIVEGKYDRIKLSSFIDGIIIETGGFRIFNNRDLVSSLRKLATTTGLIILTDSDSSGLKIRNFLKGVLPKESKLINVFIPQIEGKEKRKETPSKEGLLGVEGLSEEVLLECFRKANINADISIKNASITKFDLFRLGLIGQKDSQEKRKIILKKMNLPLNINTNTMLELINTLLTDEEFLSLL